MKNLFILITITLLLNAQSLIAQDRFSFELRSGASFATQELGDADLTTGFGFEGILDYRFMSQLSAYIGWGWNRFTGDDAFTGSEVDFEETGYLFGLQFNHPLGETPLAFYARAGGIFNHIELENEEGDITDDSGHGLGYRVGAGLAISLGSNWHLKPGVKFQSLSRDIDMSVGTTSVDLTYISVGIGIAKRF